MSSYHLNNDQLEGVLNAIDPVLSSPTVVPLTGGHSSYVFKLSCYRDDEQNIFVLRIPKQEVLEVLPHVTGNEFKLLELLDSIGISVPKPILLDESKNILPNPFMVIGWVNGTTDIHERDLKERLKKMASVLIDIHSVDVHRQDVAFLPRRDEVYYREHLNKVKEMDNSLRESEIRSVLTSAWPFPHANTATLQHGDYWFENVMWEGSEPVVIDWVDASIGEPLEDLGNARMELLWVFGEEAVKIFTDEYKRKNPDLDYRDLPYWDLCAALRPAFKIRKWAYEDDVREAEMRRWHEMFVEQALEKLY